MVLEGLKTGVFVFKIHQLNELSKSLTNPRRFNVQMWGKTTVYKRWCLFVAISWLQYNLSGDHKKSQLVVHFPLCINDKDCLDQWPRDRKFKVQAIASIIKTHRAKKYITFQTHSIPPFCKT